VLDTLGEKAGDIVTQISVGFAARLGKLLDDKNVQNLSRTLDNVATASDGLREMPAILASAREALSDTNLKNLETDPCACRKDRRRKRTADGLRCASWSRP
jgi:phospholipid/cholesterol/gamma-HCH transport system substrate-binding protein